MPFSERTPLVQSAENWLRHSFAQSSRLHCANRNRPRRECAHFFEATQATACRATRNSSPINDRWNLNIYVSRNYRGIQISSAPRHRSSSRGRLRQIIVYER
jgi:hypothetical protein